MSPNEKSPQHIFINDVTLRDGEQAPGNTMTTEQKLAMAKQLVALGVNGIEAGFAVASPGDFEAVETIADEVGSLQLPRASIYGEHPRISSLARLTANDIEQAIAAVQPAPNRGVHVFISTSAQQIIKFDDAIKKRGGRARNMNDFVWKLAIPNIEDGMRIIRERDPDAKIQFSLEDWTRTDIKVSDEIIMAAARHGAHIINLPDTVGAGIPKMISIRVAQVRSLLDACGFNDVIISWHGHNDTGQSVACAMEAMYAGARQFEPTILGIGERTGNFSFEGFLAALDANKPVHEIIIDAEICDSIVREETKPTATKLAEILEIEISKEHPIVGKNAFAHEAGIHQHGVIAGRASGENPYEVLKPDVYGATSTLILGKHSGWAGIQDFLDQQHLPYAIADRQRFVDALSIAADDRRKGLSDDEVLEQVYYPTIIALTNEGTKRVRRIEDYTGDGADDAEWVGQKQVKIVMNDGAISGGCGYTKVLIGKASQRDSELLDAAMEAVRQEIPATIIDYDNKIKNPTEGSHSDAVGTIVFQSGIHQIKGVGIAQGVDASNLLAIENAFDRLWALLEYERIISAQKQ